MRHFVLVHQRSWTVRLPDVAANSSCLLVQRSGNVRRASARTRLARRVADVRPGGGARAPGPVRRRGGRRQPGVRRRRARRLAARLPQRLPPPRRGDRVARRRDGRQPRVPLSRLGVRLGRQAQVRPRLRRRSGVVSGRPDAHADLRRPVAQPRVRPPRRQPAAVRRGDRPVRCGVRAVRPRVVHATSGESSATSPATGRRTPTTTSRATTCRCSTRASAGRSTCRPTASMCPTSRTASTAPTRAAGSPSGGAWLFRYPNLAVNVYADG